MTDGSVSGQLILIILIVFNLYTVAIAVPITGLLTALITAVITSIIVCLVMRRNTKRTTGGGAGGPVYDVPTINKEQQIIDTQLNTAYGQIDHS